MADFADDGVAAGGGGRLGWTRALAVLSGLLLLLAVGVLCAVLIADVVGRYLLRAPVIHGELFGTIETYAGLGFAAIALLALPDALAATFFRRGAPPARSRSALAVVPGAALALLVGIAAIAVLLVNAPGDRGLNLAVSNVANTFAQYVFLYFPIMIVLAAALGGARSPEATAAAAAPLVLVALVAILGVQSIAKQYLALFGPAAVAVALLALMFAFAPARAVFPWVAGLALGALLTAPLAIGVMTPTEAAAVFGLPGIAVALLVRCTAMRQPLLPMLRQAGTEMAALILVLAVAALVSLVAALLGWSRGAPPALEPRIMLAVGGAAIFVMSWLFTPALAIGVGYVFLHPILSAMGWDATWAGTIVVLLGLAAIALRSGRGRATAAATGSLPAFAAVYVAIVFIGLAVVVALFPAFAMEAVNRAFN